MALRQIRKLGDPILYKKSKKVKEMTPKLSELINDMWDTMHDADGVGLAAVQVGVLKDVVIIEINEETKFTLINPEIISEDGEQTDYEGCLSVPGKTGMVTRPEHVVVKAFNENMESVEIEGNELLARAICHELDHLEGNMYVDLVEGELKDVEDVREEEEAKE